MHNKLLKQKNYISVSALVGEENTAQERAAEFFCPFNMFQP